MSVDLRPFPMQDGPPIPWYVAEAIHRHLYRERQPLERVAERGGFGWTEVAYMWDSRRRVSGPDWGTTDTQRAACRAEIKGAAPNDRPVQGDGDLE